MLLKMIGGDGDEARNYRAVAEENSPPAHSGNRFGFSSAAMNAASAQGENPVINIVGNGSDIMVAALPPD